MRIDMLVSIVLCGGIGLLSACSATARDEEPRSGSTTRSPIPEGFVAVKPGPEDFYAANSSDQCWQVALDSTGTGVLVESTEEHSQDTGPPLPFDLPARDSRWNTELPGRRHTLALADGFLVGIDRGEFGGALDFYDPDGRHITRLVEENTQSVLLLEGNLISLHGVNHLSISEGSVRFWSRDRGILLPDGETSLDGGPECFVVDDGDLWILTANGLWRVAGHEVVQMHKVKVGILYPNSLVVDEGGNVWAGMRWFVLHLKKRANGFEEEWLAPLTAPK